MASPFHAAQARRPAFIRRWQVIVPLALAALAASQPGWCLADAAPEPAAISEADAVFFERSIRPILVTQCYECHAGKEAEAGLRLDSLAAAMAGGDSGPAIVPDKPGESLLISAIHYGEERQMPPQGKLDDSQIEALSKWVERGAPWPVASTEPRTFSRSRFEITDEDREFWSFQPVADPPVPPLSNEAWPRGTIDSFILARLEEANLRPSPPADKRTLLRRATFDLIGLPPTPEEIEAFLADDSPDAFARVVDRLLASPHYGERWARHWLDIARYGEDQAHTFQARKYPQGFRYRDWIVGALNEDMPYDQFLRAQLAADLLGPADHTNEDLAALGFFATGPVYYGDGKKLDQIDDRIDTLTRGLLGLTVSCARCHDHKFDPIPTADYYSLAGIFASTEYVDVPLVSPEEAKAAEEAEAERLRARKERRRNNAPPPYPHLHTIRDADELRTMHVHIRGNPDVLGEEVPRRYLAILAAGEPEPFAGSGRRELADLIACRDNPLTARVIVNRVWRQHFGRGLVETPSNFGRSGAPPSHPELLDHLATRFVESGWSLKELHRQMMLSATYQQTSRSMDAGWETDPDNRLLWRMNRRRLEVEAWRDAILAVAGTLDTSLGGPSVDLSDANNRRRTLYAQISRHELDPLLRLFDFPDPNITSDGRPETMVPLQQLFVLNSRFMAASARALAERVSQAEQDDQARIRRAILLAFGREPTGDELQWGVDFVRGDDAVAAPGGARSERRQDRESFSRLQQYAQVLLATSELMYVD